MNYLLYFLPILVIADYKYYVSFGEVKTLFKITDAIDAQLVLIDEENAIIKDRQYCFIADQILELQGTMFLMPNYQIEDNNDVANIFQNILLDLVFIDETELYGLTANNNLFHVSLSTNFSNIHNLELDGENDIQLPQLVGSSQYLILTYVKKAYVIDIRNNYQTEQIPAWSNTSIRYFTQIIDNFIFSVTGENGFEIYQINNSYKLFNITAQAVGVTSIDFRDFSIQKLNEKKYVAYILCKNNGVIVIEITIIRDMITQKLLLKFIGPKTDGIAIDLYDEDHVFVAYKSNHQYYIIQYKIEAYNKKWGSVSRHNVLNRIIDIDANSNYLLVQGCYRHTIIYYQEKQKPIQFTLSSIKQFILQDKMIVGATSDYIFQFQPSINPYQIKCFIDTDTKQFEQKYKLMYRTNSTWRQQEFKVVFNQKQFEMTISFILMIIILLTIFILLILTFRQWRTQRQQNCELIELEQKLKQLPQNRASKLLMPHTFRATQQSVEHRINTLNYAEDTMLPKDPKY